MSQQPAVSSRQITTAYEVGDIVLYRDHEAFWIGESRTVICRVEHHHRHNARDRYALSVLGEHAETIRGVDPAYMRILPPEEVMWDIDTASLAEEDPGAMTPAAVAWLRQQHSASTAADHSEHGEQSEGVA